MKPAMINETYEGFRAELVAILKDLDGLIGKINNPALETVVGDLRANVTEPFLFVVVGEIKSGKSSFINALLQEPVCAVDPAPCTDVIQELVYASERRETRINPHLVRIGLPVDILRDIAIVDTPGTNTIIAHHHEITERFIPSSGLVLFVFPAKNPHTRSAWELLDFVKEDWKKRVVFVLQQADLTTEKELAVNREKVAEYAADRGIPDPVIFVVSAKKELEGNADSGFGEMRTFIRDTVTGGRHFFLKLDSVSHTTEQLLRKVYDALKLLEQQLAADKAAVDRIEAHLSGGKAAVDRDVQYLVDRLLAQYDRAAEQIRSEFVDGFSVFNLFKRGVGAAVGRSKPVKKWMADLQERFEARMTAAFEDITAEGGGLFIRTFQQLTDDIVRELGKADAERYRQADHLVDIGEKRQETVDDIRRKVKELAARGFVSDRLTADPGSMPNQLVGGSALTVLGVTLYASHIAFLDVTGGILAGVGLLMAGGVLVVKKGKILREFDDALAGARTRFAEQLTDKLTTRFGMVHETIRRSVMPFFEDVLARDETLTPLMDAGQDIQRRLTDVRHRIHDAVEEGH